MREVIVSCANCGAMSMSNAYYNFLTRQWELEKSSGKCPNCNRDVDTGK
jgi:hypothetical protein